MSNLFAKLTNLFDQDFMSFEEGMPIFDWLNKHREDINDIERSYLNDFNQLKQQIKEKDKEIKLNQTQLAINELGEARKRIYALMYQENKCLNKEDCVTDCLEIIDNQIKMLKKEI